MSEAACLAEALAKAETKIPLCKGGALSLLSAGGFRWNTQKKTKENPPAASRRPPLQSGRRCAPAFVKAKASRAERDLFSLVAAFFVCEADKFPLPLNHAEALAKADNGRRRCF